MKNTGLKLFRIKEGYKEKNVPWQEKWIGLEKK